MRILEMQREDLKSDVAACNALISALKKGKQPQPPLEPFGEVPDYGVVTNAVSCSSMTVCPRCAAAFNVAPADEVAKAVIGGVICAAASRKSDLEEQELIREMQREGLKPDAITCNALISAFVKAKHPSVSGGCDVMPNAITYSSMTVCPRCAAAFVVDPASTACAQYAPGSHISSSGSRGCSVASEVGGPCSAC